MLDKQMEIDSMMSNLSCEVRNPQQEEKSFMPESVQKTKKTISQGKYGICGNAIRPTISSKISEADSISKEKDLLPYWTPLCRERSKKLLSVTETGSVGSDLSLLQELQVGTTAGSWFSTAHNSHLKKSLSETLFPSSMCLAVEFTDSTNTVIRSRKTRIYPKNPEQKKFKRFCGLSRYWFNQAVFYLNNFNVKASIQQIRKIQNLTHPDWAFNCPQRIREHAMSDACNAVKNAKIKFKQTGKFQEVGFRTRKDFSQGFGFDKQSLKDSAVFRGSNNIQFYAAEEIDAELEGTRILCENGRWFLVSPRTVRIKIPETQRLNLVALDPGVRTFQTYYSESCHGKLGEGDFKRIYRLCLGLDQIYSRISKADARSRKRLRKSAERLRWKIRDLIDDVQKKTAYFLVSRFDTVAIPYFETSKMVSKLHSKVARSMLNWAHFRFKQHLISKGEQYSCGITEISEAYTSKTCSYCGKIQNIGSKKVMKCSCGACVDRDYNGARGIYLRALMATSAR